MYGGKYENRRSERQEVGFNKSIARSMGKRLIHYGIENYSIERLTVNEQNPQARGFYEHMGFRVYKITDLDEQGNPYPILYMSR